MYNAVLLAIIIILLYIRFPDLIPIITGSLYSESTLDISMFLAEKVMQVLFLKPNHLLPQRELCRTSNLAASFMLAGFIKVLFFWVHAFGK